MRRLPGAARRWAVPVVASVETKGRPEARLMEAG